MLGFSLSSYTHLENKKTFAFSSLVINMNYSSMGLRGFGGKLVIRELATGEKFESHTKIGFNSFIIIENLPSGKYEVVDLKIITGGPVIILRDKQIFDTLTIESPQNYYLGNYLTKKIKPLLEYHIEVTSINADNESKIYKKLGKLSNKWLDLEINYSQNLFKIEKTRISLRH